MDTQTLAAIGRMTVAATELELVAEWAGAAGGLERHVDAVGTQLLIARRALRRLVEEGAAVEQGIAAGEGATREGVAARKGDAREGATGKGAAEQGVAAGFDELTAQLVRSAAWLREQAA